MSEDRETYEITTPRNGRKVILRAWINGREKQKIDGAMFNSIESSGDGTNMRPKMNDTILASQENASIQAVVVSVDGSEQSILDTILDMHVKDFQYVLENVKKVVDGDLDEKKENASKTNTLESSTEAEAESQTLVSI